MRNGGQIKENNVKGKSKNNGNKVVIKNKTKFFTFIIIALIILIVIISLIVSSSKIEIDENTNISELNVEKYSEEIKAEYELEGKDSKFLEDWGFVQDGVGRYLIENYPADPTQLTSYIEGINETLKSQNWEILNIEKPTMWNGIWSINENGNLDFKFASKDIEPNWAITLSDQGYIILN